MHCLVNDLVFHRLDNSFMADIVFNDLFHHVKGVAEATFNFRVLHYAFKRVNRFVFNLVAITLSIVQQLQSLLIPVRKCRAALRLIDVIKRVDVLLQRITLQLSV